MTVPASGVRPRRTWPQRILIAANLAIIVACLSGAGTLGWFYYQFGKLPRLDLAKGTLAPEQPGGDPQNFLLVGSDSRAFVDNPEDQKSFGNQAITGGARADTIMLVRVDPRAKTVAMVSFPRDLFLQIARTNGRNRINTAFDQGPEQLIETITQNFNVPIHHYAQVDFRGFKGLVDAVGGVKVYLAAPVRDWDGRRNVTGLDIRQTGCLNLTGTQALAYVRSRHFETLENGRWKPDPSGDFGRIKRQQDFVIRAVREALTKDLLNPARANRLAQVAVKNAKISNSLDLRDILELGKSFHSLDPGVIQQYTLPVEPYTGAGGASYVRIIPTAKAKADAETILDVFRGIAPAVDAPVTASETNVQVMNGSGVDGLAGDATSQLQQLGFGVGTPGTVKVTTTTTVRYAPGQRAKAELVARYLKSDATLLESTGQKVDVQLVLGQGFAGVLAQPRALQATTTTAAPSGSTTTLPPSPQC
jgi:LCP family protein required for cell wall assembly